MTNPTTEPASDLELRRRLGRELTNVLEDLLFNLEHGVPWKVIHELDRIAVELGRIDAREVALKAEITAFQAGVNELFATREAAEEVLLHGERIASRLRG